jgi:RNA-binding protein Musashi
VARNRIFVGGLDYTLRESDIRHYFERYGSVRDVQLMRDPNTGASRGFGFITFNEEHVAEKLITEV